MKRNYLILKEALLSVIVMKLFILLFLGIMHVLESLNPIELAVQEIDFLDLYYNQEQRTSEPESMDVVLINSGSIPDTSLEYFRNDFANILSVIEKDFPAVVGIDIEFETPTNNYTDSILSSELSAFPHLVLGVYGEKNAITPSDAKLGGISLIGDITETKRYYQLKANDTLSFALAIAEEFLNRKIESPSNPILIDYRYDFSKLIDWKNSEGERTDVFNSIPTIEGGEILSKLDDTLYVSKLNAFLKDKIVLFGHLGKDSSMNPYDSEDKHIVPGMQQSLLGKVPTTPGLIIHTQVIEMLVNDRIIYEFQGFWKIIIEWILLFMIAILYVYLAHRSIWFKPIVLPISFVLIFLMVFIALLLRDSSIYWSIGALNLQIVILIEAVEFYEPISKWLNKKWHVKSYFTHEADH